MRANLPRGETSESGKGKKAPYRGESSKAEAKRRTQFRQKQRARKRGADGH